MESTLKRTWAEIDLDHLTHNFEVIRRHVGDKVKLLGVVKADGYGHGAVEIAKRLEQLGAGYLAVSNIDECEELRDSGVTLPILMLGFTPADQTARILQLHMTQAVQSYAIAKEFSDRAVALGGKMTVHIKLDTGMGRIGMQPTDESIEEIKKIYSLPNIEINGIFTHFACADEEDKTSCNNQKKKYLDFVGKLDKAGVEIPIKHMCNSAGIIEFDDNFLDMVRSGIMTYGLYPSEEVDRSKLELHPALELKSHIAYIKSVGPGFTVSYGSTFTSKSNMRIATVPVGYGDGYPRALSNKGKVLIHGKFANIIGRVCMDQFMVDVTDIPEAKQGDEVTLIGKDQDNVITVEDVADNAHSFNYEFCCGINRRVPRVYYKDGKYLETVDYLD